MKLILSNAKRVLISLLMQRICLIQVFDKQKCFILIFDKGSHAITSYNQEGQSASIP